MDFVRDAFDAHVLVQVFGTIALLGALILARRAVLLRLRTIEQPLEVRQRWQVHLRNIVAALFLVGALTIWADELRGVAVYLLAVAAAFAIALKELVMCLTGALLRSGAGGLELGDRIEIKGIRGDVVDIGAFSTTLVEVGPGHAIHQATGRVIVLPNSVFLGESFANESLTKEYVFHTLVIPLDRDVDLDATEHALLEATHAASADYYDDARAQLARAAAMRNIEPPSAEPRVWVHVVDPKRIDLSLRFLAPARARGRIEQTILRQFLRG